MNTLGATHSGPRVPAEPTGLRPQGGEALDASLDLFGAVLGALKGSLGSDDPASLDPDRPAGREDETPSEPAPAPIQGEAANPLALLAAVVPSVSPNGAGPRPPTRDSLEALVARASLSATAVAQAGTPDAVPGPGPSDPTDVVPALAEAPAAEPAAGMPPVAAEARTRVVVVTRETHFAPVLPRILAARDPAAPPRAPVASGAPGLSAEASATTATESSQPQETLLRAPGVPSPRSETVRGLTALSSGPVDPMPPRQQSAMVGAVTQAMAEEPALPPSSAPLGSTGSAPTVAALAAIRVPDPMPVVPSAPVDTSLEPQPGRVTTAHPAAQASPVTVMPAPAATPLAERGAEHIRAEVLPGTEHRPDSARAPSVVVGTPGSAVADAQAVSAASPSRGAVEAHPLRPALMAAPNPVSEPARPSPDEPVSDADVAAGTDAPARAAPQAPAPGIAAAAPAIVQGRVPEAPAAGPSSAAGASPPKPDPVRADPAEAAAAMPAAAGQDADAGRSPQSPVSKRAEPAPVTLGDARSEASRPAINAPAGTGMVMPVAARRGSDAGSARSPEIQNAKAADPAPGATAAATGLPDMNLPNLSAPPGPTQAATAAQGPAQQIADAILGQVARGPAGAVPTTVDGPLRLLTLQLHPADLGVVLVRMRLRDGQLEMNLHASREETATLLRAGGEVLNDLLRQGGYQPERVTISSGAPAAMPTPADAQAFPTRADANANPDRATPDQSGRRQPDGREAAPSDTSERIHESVSSSPDRSGVYL
ncbi:flagellar hook-length control protein FliK [Methylobacterium sp. J-068]|uniref:flagellar hook-length control protein FliK n=1 Tax=Methylobacterium sp. J-068 TaxID=2836649 RepID=UPI001FB8F740|nr:flagellar hook-length control protein FliK [Methylobacterium sp. J-068]MCJ2036247.1 flagellar hook-length control protein FliK [Methylobacterium sp. J-068]